MSDKLLRDPEFFRLLLRIDEDLAEQTRSLGCSCGGKLHVANYPRRPRGGREDLGRRLCRRLSFCCARDGCRRRATPPSVRFLGRRVYWAAVVVLASTVAAGVTPRRAAELRRLLGAGRHTLERWRRWWREGFASTPFWKIVRARFMPPVTMARLPASLLERFRQGAEAERLTAALRFLSPVSTQGGLASSPRVR